MTLKLRPIGPLPGGSVRRSRIQARHLYISARKRSSLGHAGKLAYPAIPLNVEGFDCPIRAHKEQGNHPARVIVDIQSLCHRLVPLRVQRAEPAKVPMRGTALVPRLGQPVDLGRVSSLNREGPSKRLLRAHYAKILKARLCCDFFSLQRRNTRRGRLS